MIIYLICGHFIILNVFLAILINYANYSEVYQLNKEDNEEDIEVDIPVYTPDNEEVKEEKDISALNLDNELN